MIIDIDIDTFTYPDILLPEVWTVEQLFDTPTLSEKQIEEMTAGAIRELVSEKMLVKGASVAVGVGSRGIDNLVLVVRTAISALKSLGMNPFIIPAMGSHGGATPEGQREVLHSYGITTESTGAEIRATMDVELVGTLVGEEAGSYAGHIVYCERNALGADAILLINRIKAHTDFRGDIESGICKMCAIGLGKRHGAEGIHRHGATGLRELMPRVGRYMAAHLPILGGIAMIENELGRTSEIHALAPREIGQDREKALLKRARKTAPHLPFEEFDLLIIDEMGKNISGAGMDTHVIGRGNMPSISESEWGKPKIRLIAVLDLTPQSHGNATALGLADLTTQRLIEKTDFTAMNINMRTSGEGGILRGRIPMIMPTGEDCVRTAIATCGQANASDVRIARIRNTADTQYLEISSALLDEARSNKRLTVSESAHTLDLCQTVRPIL